MNGPKVSIVTVCFNAIESIEETIISVLNQTYDNIEYVIVDGGSSDGTVEIIKKYSYHLAYWTSERDNGIYDAMNKGIRKTSGEYIYFLNAGDSLVSSGIIYSIFSMPTHNNLIYGNIYNKSKNKVMGGIFNSFRLTYENICHQAIFYPKYLFKDREFNQNYKFLADWDFNLSIWKKIKSKYIDIVIAYYEGNGVSENILDTQFKKDHKYLNIKYLGIIAYVYSLLHSLKKRFYK